jgi:signal transduction histidine kinase
MGSEFAADRVLILTPTGRDAVAMADVLGKARFDSLVTVDVGELVHEASRGAGAVFIAEEALISGYSSLSAWAQDQPAWSDLPFIVFSSRINSRWLHAFRGQLAKDLHNVTLLERPVQTITLVSALRTALRARQRQYELRAHLQAQAQAAQQLEALVEARTFELAATNEKLNREIIEREKVEEQLRHAQKMEAIGRLTGGIAHDFNNMLAIVVGALDILGRRLKDVDPNVRKYIQSASAGAQRAAQLTQRLLAFSRQTALKPQTIDVNKLINNMSELLRGSLGRAIVLEAVGAGGLWPVYADAVQLENAILNIALNGRDAMPDGGKLTIELQNMYLDKRYAAENLGVTEGQFLMISITDTGVGMTAETMNKVFEPFFTTKGVGKGTGLGLSQVYGFVKQSQGHIKIYSEVGKGTSVKIYLPRHLQGAEPETPEIRDSFGPRAQQELILVVDDEPAVRDVAVDALNELGYRVLSAFDGKTALELIDRTPEIELLFTDIVMPEMSGSKLVEEALRRRPDLKVLYATGFTRNAVVHNGVVGRGVHLIGKPYSLDELSNKIREVLDS